MTLLIASYAYPPLRYPRAIQVARLVAHLPPEEVIVVCALEPGAGDQSLLDAYPDDTRRVVRVPWSLTSTALRKLRSQTIEDRLLVPDLYRPWQRDAQRAIRRDGLLDRGDVFATFGQPMSDHLLGLRLARRTGARWIAHFSDPWVDSPFRLEGALTQRLNADLERRVVMRADALVFTSEETVDLVLAKYPAHLTRKAHVLPHSYDSSLYPATTAHHDRILVRYLGNFYGNRGPEWFFAALRTLLAAKPEALDGVRIELIGHREQPLADTVFAGLPAGLVSLRDAVDYRKSLELMRESDLLLVLDAPAKQSVFLPSKLIDYVGAQRPIFALTPAGAAANLVLAIGGWHADPTDPVAAASVLMNAFDAVRNRSVESWGREDVLKTYAATAVAGRFWDLVQAVRRTKIT